jgi:UDP-N-acetylmuramate-alanine ligase
VMKEESSVSPGLVHFVGIGGAGLSALAFLALEQMLRKERECQVNKQ